MTVFSNLSLLATLAVIVTPIVTIDTANAQQSYPLTCRGGGTCAFTPWMTKL